MSLATKPLCCSPKPMRESLPVIEKTGVAVSVSPLCQPISLLSSWPIFYLSRRLSASDVVLIKLADRLNYIVVWHSKRKEGQRGMGWQWWVTRSSVLWNCSLYSCFLGNCGYRFQKSDLQKKYLDIKGLSFKEPLKWSCLKICPAEKPDKAGPETFPSFENLGFKIYFINLKPGCSVCSGVVIRELCCKQC